ncbi:hypothetical protein LOC68_22105 [Blastopirellula sp. JC732]|uniref:Uncharacterized protein n=1 Tax=Blastopirellula sediminis TaxID=2894196 RepID=A0A9X1SLV2_9BACT|nr:hypothetical protein [Blastopirellula sediminis]MCC9605606.1 hypothetical protein [Blastopirellula sediminis]MCC9631094.1 hypothetical protein [Blastopirellula sediminis]
MSDVYRNYLEAPTSEGFAQLQAEVAAEPDFDPQGGFAFELEAACQRGDFREAYWRTTEMPFAWVASPAAHFFAGVAASEMGCYGEADLERFLFQTMLEGILATGDGSAAAPYRITHLSDENDLLAYFSVTQGNSQRVGQQLLRQADRLIDAVHCDNDQTLHFDVTHLAGALPTARPRPASKFRSLLAKSRLGFDKRAAF